MVVQKSAMGKWQQCIGSEAAMGKGSIASATLNEGNPVKMLAFHVAASGICRIHFVHDDHCRFDKDSTLRQMM